jgi:hypothetical protein
MNYQHFLAYQRQWVKTPRGRYNQHKGKATARGIPFLLTFEEWWDIWQASGKWEQRGRRHDQYVMARFGDLGPYARGNVKVCLVSENAAESNRNNDNPSEQRSAAAKAWWAAMSQERRESMSRALSVNNGSHRPEVRAKQRADALGRRMVIRESCRCWSYPGDADYPD